MKKVLIILTITLFIVSCSNKNQNSKTNDESIKINKIDCNTAKEYIEKGAILIDVRTTDEFNEKTLDNAINIPVDKIDNIKDVVKDKNQDVIVFCQNGKRSNTAANKLKDLGYKNIYDLGSINNCK